MQNVIRDVTIYEASRQTSKDFEKLITKLQAHIRGYLIRKKIAADMVKIIKIQAWWRGQLQRRDYARILENKIKDKAEDACKFSRVKAKYQIALDHYTKHVSIIYKGFAAALLARPSLRFLYSSLILRKSIWKSFFKILEIIIITFVGKCNNKNSGSLARSSREKSFSFTFSFR